MALGQLFGEVLPPELLARTTKACFDSAFWTDRSRELAASWDGEGIDTAVVHPERLQDEWSAPEPDAHTYLLLQALWLQKHKSSKNGHLDDGRVADAVEAA
jgi:asparagine synthase (glutamine-hydrolysing)